MTPFPFPPAQQNQNDPKAGRSNRLDELLRSKKEGLKENNKHTAIVRFMRILLPLVAVSMVGLVMTWPQVDEQMSKTAQKSIQDDSPIIGQNELINPRFESMDEKGQPYVVTADRALQNADDRDVLLLTNPVSAITLNDGISIGSQSMNGTYNQLTEDLLLSGDVTLLHSDGYELMTDNLSIDLKNSKASTSHPIISHGPLGTLNANGLEADMKSGLITFTGPARLVLKKSVKGL
jgi:lipopolysaccharide export system protein LptC